MWKIEEKITKNIKETINTPKNPNSSLIIANIKSV